MNKVTLFEEYRLIERSESEVNGAWRGAHLLLFFMAFVFGSFCTFCFHMLMYLFDEKCVLFPKLLPLTSTRHNVIYEFIPNSKEVEDLPVDFLSTQWVEKNACTLPTYVPLLSGIFGLVWTTMFLMCSTGSRTLTGLQRPWRVLPPIFLFSLAMGSLCVYSSAVTHYGLQELCYKLGEITGSSTCTYAVNVATLAYERRIRGVYQATRLTILTAWLHTACWILSALLALARVLLAVDFQLVRINVDLRGDIDKMLQRHEQQIRTVSPDPDLWIGEEYGPLGSDSSTRVHFEHKSHTLNLKDEVEPREEASDRLFLSTVRATRSQLSLIPDEKIKLSSTAYNNVPKDHIFIVDLLYDILDSISVAEMLYQSSSLGPSSSLSLSESESESAINTRQLGQEKISSKISNNPSRVSVMSAEEAEKAATEIKRVLKKKMDKRLVQTLDSPHSSMNAELEKPIDDEKAIEEEKNTKKSNLKTVGIQTDKPKGKVQIKSPTGSPFEYISTMAIDNSKLIDKIDVDKNTADNRSTEKNDNALDVEIKENIDLAAVKIKKVDEDVVEKHDDDIKKVEKAILKKEDNAESNKTDNNTIEVKNKDEPNIQDDIKKDVVIDIEENVDDVVVNIETVGEVSINVDDKAGSNDDVDKQIKKKPKEKQD